MKKKIVYTDGPPIGRYRVIKDFLPPPGDLAFKDPTIKITISLSLSSIEFFKRMAKRKGASYQQMIRKLVDAYVARYRR